jgi:hypothetical protein
LLKIVEAKLIGDQRSKQRAAENGGYRNKITHPLYTIKGVKKLKQIPPPLL